MSSKEIEESQEQREGKSISQAGGDQKMPVGVKGSHRSKNHPVDLHIPNQDNSSASNQRKAEDTSAKDEQQ